MTPQDQENTFKKLLEVHPAWPKEYASGFVHGLADEERHAQPQASFLRSARRRSDADLYAMGYMLGFAVSRGIDACFEEWFVCTGLA